MSYLDDKGLAHLLPQIMNHEDGGGGGGLLI